jgi:hypothetical protein
MITCCPLPQTGDSIIYGTRHSFEEQIPIFPGRLRLKNFSARNFDRRCMMEYSIVIEYKKDERVRDA